MKKYNGLALRLAISASSLVMLASCTTSEYARVQNVVPAAKPSADEIAMLSTLSATDTSQPGATETAALDLKPVDFATNTDIEMAYAVPQPRPLAGEAAITALTNGEAVVTANAAAALAAQPADSVTSASTALAAQPKTRSIEPFVTATRNTDLNQLIAKYATLYDVPERLVHRVVRRESNYNPGAVHRGNWGLMQIRYNTARGMGYDGNPNGLLDAETNLKFAVKYLRGAYLVADRNEDSADWLYRTGYYYQAKKKGLLNVIHN
jgi:soluble lytic murein transglycosylase-like protein